MNLKKRIEVFDQDSKVLEKIASQYSEGSEEYQVLRRAGIALWYVLREKHPEFKEFCEKVEGELSPEEKQHLREMGIDPDEGIV